MPTVFGLLESTSIRTTPMHIVGVGGTGSHLAYEVARLGAEVVHVHDFDTISDYNWRNQRYTQEAAGRYKVDELARTIARDCAGTQVHIHREAVGAHTPLSGIVFLCVDRMSARKEIFDGCLRSNKDVQLVTDTRMTATYARLLTLDPCIDHHCSMWDHLWYPDAEATNDAASCGAPTAVGPTASFIASVAAWQLVRLDHIRRGMPAFLPNEIRYDLLLNSPPEYVSWDE